MSRKLAEVLSGGLAVVLLVCGCQQQPMHSEPVRLAQVELHANQQPAAVDEKQVRPVPDLPKPGEPSQTQLAGRVSTSRTPPMKDMRELLPDPTAASRTLTDRLARIRDPERLSSSRDTAKLTEQHLAEVERANTVYLSLAECVRRALANNLAIRFEGYSPAIETTRIVEAEAQFDPQVFFNFTENKQNAPSSVPEIDGTTTDTRSINTGLAKLLATGAAVQAGYSFSRVDSDLSEQVGSLDPAYTTNYALEIRQPLLRNFGIDFNRAQIRVSRNNHEISVERFRRQAQDTLLEVERRYWELVQARRQACVVAEVLAQAETLLDTVQKRVIFDSIPAQIPQTEARVAERQAEYVRAKAALRDAEDRLKHVLNDPQLNAAEDLEIVPTDNPVLEPMVVDTLAELQTALENRSELREAELQIKNAHIALGVAKNQALPRFDVTFRTTFNSLGSNPDDAWDKLNAADFIEYMVMLEFEWPIGNRGPRAAVRRARLEQSQALVGLKRVTEEIILSVNLAVRDLQTSFNEIMPNIQQAQASGEFIRMLELRKETMDANTLNTIFGSQESLAAARVRLLQALVGYNIAIVNLERSKGTLLKYNNVVLAEAE
ncbi:MAG TPA: TolC family protein [Phycisphaerae bacterium]|nr:TolC family protein [Phycisphaerae bacterium]